jgi:hypothetical protein
LSQRDLTQARALADGDAALAVERNRRFHFWSW